MLSVENNKLGESMTDPPRERLELRAFLIANFGEDCFGPLKVIFMRKLTKPWCCLFTCLTTRALHAEIVPRLKADACLDAITRFFTRRRKPNIRSIDDGTKVLDAAKKWIAARHQLDIEQISAQKQITWKFNPPGASHFRDV